MLFYCKTVIHFSFKTLYVQVRCNVESSCSKKTKNKVSYIQYWKLHPLKESKTLSESPTFLSLCFEVSKRILKYSNTTKIALQVFK